MTKLKQNINFKNVNIISRFYILIRTLSLKRKIQSLINRLPTY